MDKIFDTPIEAGSLTAMLLQQFINKKFVEANHDFEKASLNMNALEDRPDSPARIRQSEQHYYWGFSNSFIIISGLSLNRLILVNFEKFRKPIVDNNHKELLEGFNKHGEEWIQDLKKEFIRIHRFINFDPLDVYKKNQELIVKNEKLEKQMSEIETMVLYLSKELENLKKPNTEIPNLIDF